MKMEKADILEMTVAYLRTVYRCPPPTAGDSGTVDSVGSGRYAAGYRQCVVEVAHYLDEVASTAYTDGVVDAVRTKLMRHLTAMLHTKVVCRPDENGRFRPNVTSFPPEVGSRSRSSWSARRRTCSSMSSVQSEPEADKKDVIPLSPAFLEAVHPALGHVPASLSPPSPDRATTGHRAAGSPSSADRDEASNASADSVDLLTARSVDGCVWRPW